MKNYKIIIQYDGSKYAGWQKQGNTKNTIQEKFELILEKLSGQAVEVIGSGRTDAGVHAKKQVANFHLDTVLSELELLEYFNSHLPQDICVLECQIAAQRFHSRFHAKQKIYCYRIWNSPIKNVFERDYLFFSPSRLDLEKMRRASTLLLGEHDFKAFCSNKRTKKSTIRRIDSIEIKECGNEIQLWFCGNGFLYHMVRILTGTLIEIGEGSRTVESISDLLKEKNRENAGFTAPASGLCLMNVIYEQNEKENDIEKQFLLQHSWKDKKGTVIAFYEHCPIEKEFVSSQENEIFMFIDGADCSEGVVEAVPPQVDCAVNIIKECGYGQLGKLILSQWKKDSSMLC